MAVQLGAHGIGSGTANGGPALPWRDNWTPWHSAAAWFLGECVAVGAVLGFLTELTRLVGEGRAQRVAARRGHGRLRKAGPAMPLTRRG